MKRNIIIFSGVITLVIILLVCDYFALFGTRTEQEFDFIEINFNPVDAQTGAPVVDVHVRCFQRNNNNACTQKKSNFPGIVAVNIPVTRLLTRTLFFKKNESLQKTMDPKLHIMLIHRNYANPVETIMIDELHELAGREFKVPMPRHILD